LKNYQSLRYQRYYNQDLDGKCVPVSRKECFAPATPPTADNPYPQRWFYDYEAGDVIRLARTKVGDELGKRNAADLRAEARHRERKIRCVWKGTKNCDQNCAQCNHQHTSRTVELDHPKSNFDIADEAANIAACFEDEQRLVALISALGDLAEEDRELLLASYAREKTVRKIAEELGFRSHTSVVKRLAKAMATLRSSKNLEAFFD
jgi:DNA-directed RNA polymerase specialized sigma24 family protein